MFLACALCAVTIIGILAIPAVCGGYTESMIRIASGKKVDIGDFFKVGFEKFWILLGANLLRFFGVLFGLLLLIIPGIYLMTRWVFISQIIVHEQMTVKESFSKSKAMTSAAFWIVLTILFINFVFGSIITSGTYGLIILAVTPFKSIVWAKYYLENLGEKK